MIPYSFLPHRDRWASQLRKLAFAVAAATLAGQAMAGAVIYNSVDPNTATVALGVNDAGHLNFFDGTSQPANSGSFGLSYRFSDGLFRDATSPGCLCEGWGVAVTLGDGSRVAGFANESSGSGGLTGGVFSSSTTKATSQIGLADAPVTVTHAYGVSLAPNLFQGNITITNTGTTTLQDVVYRRAMDWDVPLTEFNEYVTHQGVVANLEANGGRVRFASNNGFASSDPRSDAGEIGLSSGTTINTDFVDAGPSDHGSVFDFAFGDLAAGESRSFNIFYGAAANETQALAALAVINPNLYSLGQSSSGSPSGEGGGESFVEGVDVPPPPSPLNDSPTFIFAFGGVGATAPGSSPENPLLPIVDVGTGVYEFAAPTPRQWYDPPFATGFRYELVGGGTFKSVAIPTGFGDLLVKLPDGTTFAIPAGGTFDFVAAGLAPTTFEIVGLSLDTGAPGYDPLTAFPTFLDFDGSPTTLLMTPLLDAGSAPIPGTALLFLTGIGLLAVRRRSLARLN